MCASLESGVVIIHCCNRWKVSQNKYSSGECRGNNLKIQFIFKILFCACGYTFFYKSFNKNGMLGKQTGFVKCIVWFKCLIIVVIGG